MTVGWYVHHHGAGHRARMRAAAPLVGGVAVLDSRELPSDVADAPVDPTAGGTLHWAPLGHRGARSRMARIAAWIEAEQPAAMVVDVSVEVALLARLLGVPTIVVAQRGARHDDAHRLAYRQAAAVVAPWSAESDLPGDLPGEAAVRFVGAISRFDGRRFSPPTPGGDVLLLVGAGGHELTGEAVGAAAASTPERTWHVAGGPGGAGAGNVVDHGMGADVARLLDACSVVVGTAGGNVVAEVAAARRPFVCLPQPRPFDEQARQAQALSSLGVAVACERWPSDWPAVLARAEALDTGRWARLHDGGGAARLAAIVREVAGCG